MSDNGSYRVNPETMRTEYVEQPPMIAVDVVFMARDKAEANAIVADLMDSRVLNEWPVLGIGEREPTRAEREWYATEYETDCRRCGSPLDSEGHCDDVTCPYSERAQTEAWTEA